MAKEKKEKTINLDDYYLIPKKFEIKEPKTLEGLEIWDEGSQMSEEYKQMLHDLSLVMLYSATQLNTGPEVKDSVSKRVLTMRTLLYAFIGNVFVDTYHKAGVLSEILDDILFRGRFKVLAFQESEKSKKIKNKDNGGSYIT